MDTDGIQNYWAPGNEPTTDNGYTTKRFKSFNGGDHEILPLQNPEVVEAVSNIYIANVIYQRDALAMAVGEDLPPDDLCKKAAKEGWGAGVCAVVDGYKILNIKCSDGAELVAEAIMTCKPGWSLIGIGTGRHDHYLYLARECDEYEVRELEQKRGKKANQRNPKDEGHHGDWNRHGGGGRNNDRGQPRGEGQNNEGGEENFEAPLPKGRMRTAPSTLGIGSDRRGLGPSPGSPLQATLKPEKIVEYAAGMVGEHVHHESGTVV
ncbi:MAG: hypothetical protein LQ347_001009 [Umbilicaria vellea]|nr:MAG: hypothetical protein LQ347_001009 [Umbilicaria vellea]